MSNRQQVPQHIGYILDGNGRWAEERGLSRSAGHKAGAEAINKLIDLALKYKVKVISLFAFSTENWKRDKKEVNYIFKLCSELISKNLKKYEKANIVLRVMGDTSYLTHSLQNKIKEGVEKTRKNNGLIVNLALNYGGRDEILRAVNNLLKSGKATVDASDFVKELYTADLPDPDMIVRTSGEQRISNFMLYQMAYSEFYFPKCYWPDYDEQQFIQTIKEFNKRERRYGGTKKEKNEN